MCGRDKNAGPKVQVKLNGPRRQPRVSFRCGSRSLVGLVEGLRKREQHYRRQGGIAHCKLTLINHPITGPIMSGSI